MAKKNNRPWGHYTNLRNHNHVLVKELVVNPGERLSLQSHDHREEYWFGVKGTGVAIVDGTEYVIAPGMLNHIPVNAVHRIDNTHGDEPLVMIEVQVGEILDENDITRYEDDYGRAQ